MPFSRVRSGRAQCFLQKHLKLGAHTTTLHLVVKLGESFVARNLVLWLIIAAVLLTVFNNFSVETQSQQVNYSQFVDEVNRDQIRRFVDEIRKISTRETRSPPSNQ